MQKQQETNEQKIWKNQSSFSGCYKAAKSIRIETIHRRIFESGRKKF